MIPLHIAGATRVMLPPAGRESDIRPLHIAEIDGCSVSRWEPTPGELALLNAGGSIELWVQGGQPPVFLTAQPHSEDGA